MIWKIASEFAPWTAFHHLITILWHFLFHLVIIQIFIIPSLLLITIKVASFDTIIISFSRLMAKTLGIWWLEVI